MDAARPVRRNEQGQAAIIRFPAGFRRRFDALTVRLGSMGMAFPSRERV